MQDGIIINPEPKRRLFQFNLRDLYFVLAVLGAVVTFTVSSAGRQAGRNNALAIYATVCIPVFCGGLLGIVVANALALTQWNRIFAIAMSMGLSLLLVPITSGIMNIRDSLFRSRSGYSHSFAAAASCKAYAEVQEIYRRTDYDRDGVLEYAQSLGELLETSPGAGDLALVDRTFRAAEATLPFPSPKAGYYFKVLTAQGSAAPGGAKNYVVNGNMTGGYALIAYPAQYDGTGRDTFMISNMGIIYQADLGDNTSAIVRTMTVFNPDSTWAAAE